ncbi:hypothetical protein Syun_004366 [Stephania yunnanensis]|uniref:Uncharacterized protein n=1 Tax=Stephania yunnanensis TaxID=152371 RepID=A0AAP0Q2G5_9MAGN
MRFAPIPHCDCRNYSKLMELDSNDRLIQFLMGLSDIYDQVRNQILFMDPLPNINKAYSVIERVEKQKQLHLSFTQDMDSAMLVKCFNSRVTIMHGGSGLHGGPVH